MRKQGGRRNDPAPRGQMGEKVTPKRNHPEAVKGEDVAHGVAKPTAAGTPRRGEKKPFDIDVMLSRIEKSIAGFKKAAMFELKEQGYSSLFEQLIACIISIRTYDEVSAPTARNLFATARTPQAIAKLSVDEIDHLISACTFHAPKARTIRAVAQRVVDEFKGHLPPNADVLLSFNGVGPKCAHLALGVAHGEAVISVDIHVHRVTNRWGYVQASTPEKTMEALTHTLPKKHWIDINRLLVPFGKHICTGNLPKCSTCPVLQYCRQVGVTSHR